jgi:hypothetical protein
MTRIESILLPLVRSGVVQPFEASAIIGCVLTVDREVHTCKSEVGHAFTQEYGTMSVEGVESLVEEVGQVQ